MRDESNDAHAGNALGGGAEDRFELENERGTLALLVL
jgi:hypothetical protein